MPSLGGERRSPRTFNFRLLRGGWGIAVDLTAIRRDSIDSWLYPNALELSEGLRVDVSRARLNRDDLEMLAKAGRSIWRSNPHPKVGPLLIEILHVNYTPTDYQPEGVGAALVGWIVEELQLSGPDAYSAHFDKAEQRYLFEWADEQAIPQ